MTKNKSNPKSRTYIEALSKISKAVSSELYLEDILRLIVTVTAEVMGSKICSLLLLDPEKKELVIRATQSVSEAYRKKPNVKVGEGIAGQVAKDGRLIMVLDVKKDKRYHNAEIAKKEGLGSLLSVPLTVKGKVIGVLNCYTSTLHEFTPAEQAVLTTVANQAAIAIDRAEWMVKAKTAEEELATRKAVERAKDILIDEGFRGTEAYRKIQKLAMDTRKSMREIAEAIILTRELKK